MIRKQIYITAEQDRFVKELAAARGLNEADVIREALDEMKTEIAEREKRVSAWAAIEAVIKDIAAAGAGGAQAYTWKREDVYDDRRYAGELRVAEETQEYRAGGSV